MTFVCICWLGLEKFKNFSPNERRNKEKHKECRAIFEVLTAVLLNVKVFSNFVPCSLVSSCRGSEGS